MGDKVNSNCRYPQDCKKRTENKKEIVGDFWFPLCMIILWTTVLIVAHTASANE